jgi:hypothetical protein
LSSVFIQFPLNFALNQLFPQTQLNHFAIKPGLGVNPKELGILQPVSLKATALTPSLGQIAPQMINRGAALHVTKEMKHVLTLIEFL